MSPKTGAKVPKKMLPIFEAIVAITDRVCADHLNKEYAQLCRELAAQLSRKRPSPLERGKIESWACGITYTIGRVNFLFDPDQTPCMRADELCASFGVSQSTGSAKAKTIMDMFKMGPFDPRWCLPSQMDRNPLVWMLEVNGFIIDVRRAPRAIQKQAFDLGLIPYIPGERPAPLLTTWNKGRGSGYKGKPKVNLARPFPGVGLFAGSQHLRPTTQPMPAHP